MKKFIRIRNLREDKDLTQEQMAKILNTTQRTYSRYENADSTIPLEMLIKIADFHNVSTDYLLERTDTKKPYKKQHVKRHREKNPCVLFTYCVLIVNFNLNYFTPLLLKDFAYIVNVLQKLIRLFPIDKNTYSVYYIIADKVQHPYHERWRNQVL